MTDIYAKTTDQVLSATILPKVACNNQNTVRLNVEFDAPWNGFAKSAVFCTAENPFPYERALSSDGSCIVPLEVLTEAATLKITIKGVRGGEVKSTTPLKFRISEGTPVILHSNPSQSVYSDLLSELYKVGEKINTESKRIDNMNSGATEDGELLDIRVGADGVTYDAAGTAVRTQIANNTASLHNAMNNADRGVMTLEAQANFGRGSLLNGSNANNPIRIRSNNMIIADRNIILKANEGYRFAVHFFTDEGVYERESGWQTKLEIAQGTLFKIVIGLVNEVDAAADIPLFAQQVTFESALSEKVTEILKKSNNDIYQLTIPWEMKGINTTTSFHESARNIGLTKLYEVHKGEAFSAPKSETKFFYGMWKFNTEGVWDNITPNWKEFDKDIVFDFDGYILIHIRNDTYSNFTATEINDIKNTVKHSSIQAAFLKSQMLSEDKNEVINSCNVEFGRLNGASYVFVRIPKTTNNGHRITPRIKLTSQDGSIDGAKRSALRYSIDNGLGFVINGGLFDVSNQQPIGQTIIDGVSIVNTPHQQGANGETISDTECYPLCIDENGILSAPYDRYVDTAVMLADGVKQAISGWGKLVENYAITEEDIAAEIVHPNKYCRQAIGQYQNGDYCVCTVDMSGYSNGIENEAGLSYTELAQIFVDKGVKFAYSLDGGGSAETVLGERQLNAIYEGTEGRIAPTVISFEIKGE